MKKKHPEHVNLERWLVSYADFITLLFAFFVVMYAISQADMAKFKSVAASIKAAFASAGPAGMVDLGGNSGGKTLNQFDEVQPSGGRSINLPAGKTHTASEPDPEIVNLKEKLEETISMELGTTDFSDTMQMVFDSRGLIIRLAVRGFFEPGQVDVSPDLQPLLDRIGRVLLTTKHLIRVEGHADEAEVQTKSFASDWELSAARGAWVVKYWIKRFGVDPKQFGVAGYGHYRPLNQSKTEVGRSSNRRIEIIILNNLYETKENQRDPEESK